MTFEQYRRGAEITTSQLQNTNTHGVQIKLLGVEDASKDVGSHSLRMFKMRRLVTASDGAKKFMISGYVFGSRLTASITSSAATEDDANNNFTQYAGPLWLIANDKIEKDK
jgi:hypothetical protein